MFANPKEPAIKVQKGYYVFTTASKPRSQTVASYSLLAKQVKETLNAFAGVAYTENQRNSRSSNVPKLYRGVPIRGLRLEPEDPSVNSRRMLHLNVLFGVAYGQQQRISVPQLGYHESIDSIAWAMTVVPKNGKQEAAKPRLDLALNRYSLQLAEKTRDSRRPKRTEAG
jgi:hypothetical protein